ncbi:MAG: hypothetical protein ACI9XZ_002661 [Alphaproteobacteria bacterium]|jgi:hypothetical protein
MSTLHAQGNADQRRYPRQQVHWSTDCTDHLGNTWSATVVDTGVGGLGLTDCPPLTVGQSITINLTDVGMFQGRVAWSKDQKCGVELLPIDGHDDGYFSTDLASWLPK